MHRESKRPPDTRVATTLTVERPGDYLKSMRRNEFCALLLFVAARITGAQEIPGRDLLEFPLGSLAEGTALSLATGDGFRNPAAIALPRGLRARFTVSSLTTGSQQGVAGQIVAVALAVPSEVTAALTVARASVDGIVRTETDPQSIGGDVPYGTIIVSAIAARRPAPNIVTGLAVRYQTGEIDQDRRAALGIDAGMVMTDLLRVDGRLGLTSFLWRPGVHAGDGAAFAGAFDARVAGHDSLAQMRAGYSYNDAPGLSREHFAFVGGRLGRWEARGGLARTEVTSRFTSRARFAVGFHYERYAVSVAREESPTGLAPVYHFTFVMGVPSR